MRASACVWEASPMEQLAFEGREEALGQRVDAPIDVKRLPSSRATGVRGGGGGTPCFACSGDCTGGDRRCAFSDAFVTCEDGVF